MFKFAVFHLVGPICQCDTQDLGWDVARDSSGLELVIICHLCNSRHIIGHAQFKARIELEVPYPNARRTQPADDQRRTVKPANEDSKVVPLFPEKK